MALVVGADFHLAGVMKRVGEVLTKAEEDVVRGEAELLNRCIPALHEVDVVLAASDAAVQNVEAKVSADVAKLKAKADKE